MEMVFPPIRDSFLMSEREATPVIKEASTRGTAISLRRLMKIFPNGEIQFWVNSPHPNNADNTPKMSPKTSPMGVHYEVQDLLVSYSKIYSRVVFLLLNTIKLALILANPRNTGNPRNPRNPKNPRFWASMAIRLDRVQRTSPIDASNLGFFGFFGFLGFGRICL